MISADKGKVLESQPLDVYWKERADGDKMDLNGDLLLDTPTLCAQQKLEAVGDNTDCNDLLILTL